MHCFLRLLAAAALFAQPACAAADLNVFASSFVPDASSAPFDHLWSHWSLVTAEGPQEPKAAAVRGGYVFVHVQNTGSAPVRIDDLAVQGIRLSEGLGKSNDRVTYGGFPGHSIHLSKLPAESIKSLEQAGEPVWWRAEPRVVEPGRTAQVVLRLRHQPVPEKLQLGLVAGSAETKLALENRAKHPRFESISFSPDLTTVHLYLRHPSGKGTAATRLYLDGRDVSASSVFAADPDIDVSVIVLRLQQPLEMMSFHTFRAALADGSAATAGIRAWGSEIAYGMWGGSDKPAELLRDFSAHNINVQMSHAPKVIADLSLEDDGYRLLQSHGIRQMTTWQGNARNPLLYFLYDEPDAHDVEIDEMEGLAPLGCLGQGLVERSESLREKDATVPQLLNVNNTSTPDNWYMYHQLADVPSIDPYYQGELDNTFSRHPGRFGSYAKPTYVYAAARISAVSAAPKPLHVILCSTQYTDRRTGFTGRYPTPEEKRIEAYYALAAGAKGLSYWWFTPENECNGVGSGEPAANALWDEIGLIGAEVRTAGPLVTMGCPAAVAISTASVIVGRALLCGTDSMVVVAVNDEIMSDRTGTVVKPFPYTTVTAAVPSWMTVRDAFQVTESGVGDVEWKLDGRNVVMVPKEFREGRLMVVTASAELRGRLAAEYEKKLAANAAALLARRRAPDAGP